MAHAAITHSSTIDLIDRKLRFLVGNWGITPTDIDDIRQDIYLDLMERLPRHDSNRSPVFLFVSACIHRKIYNIIRARRARFNGPVRSMWNDNDQQAIGVEEESAAERVAHRHHGLGDLRIDLSEAMAELPPHLRDIAIRLADERPRRIAADLGIPHDRIYRHVAEIREVFARHALHQYVG